MGMTFFRLFVCVLICLTAGLASAVPLGFNWSDNSVSTDSGGVRLGPGSTLTVVWDVDLSGLAGWQPCDPVPTGDQVLLDINNVIMTTTFGSGPGTGRFIGNWTVDPTDPWAQDGTQLYGLASVPAAISSSGLDEYGVTSLMTIANWANNSPVSHDITGGGSIVTAPCIPEPAAIMVLAAGLGAIMFRKRK